MAENDGKGRGFSLERISLVRAAAESAREIAENAVGGYRKLLGNRRERREFVIASVAKNSLRFEAGETLEIARNKYWELEFGNDGVPAVIVSMHGHYPGRGEIVSALHNMDLGENDVKKYEDVLDEWFVERETPEGQKRFKEVHPDLYSVLYVVGLAYDERTDELTREIAEVSGAACLTIKKGRPTVDANRPSFFRPKELQATGENKGAKVAHLQLPTSARAGLNRALTEVLRRKVGLDRRGKLKDRAAAVMIHGMSDKATNADIVIAGGRRGGENEEILADQELLLRFGVLLDEELRNLGVELYYDVPDGDGKRHVEGAPVVAIHQRGLGENKALFLRGGDWRLEDRAGGPLAGGGIGLGHFRKGGKFRVGRETGRDLSRVKPEDELNEPEQERILVMPGFGDNLKVFQVEVGAALRQDVEKRQQLAQALSAVVLRLFKDENSQRQSTNG